MKKHGRKILVALAAVAVLAAAGGWALFTRPAGVNRRGFDRIQVGITQRHVEAILGGPPGDYTDPDYNPLDMSCLVVDHVNRQTDGSDGRCEGWFANGCLIRVYFRSDATVADKDLEDRNMIPRPTTLERVWRRIGW